MWQTEDEDDEENEKTINCVDASIQPRTSFPKLLKGVLNRSARGHEKQRQRESDASKNSFSGLATESQDAQAVQ